MKKLLTLVVLVGLLVTTFGLGAIWAHKKLWPWSLLRSLDAAVVVKRAVVDADVPDKTIVTGHTELQLVSIPLARWITDRIDRGGIEVTPDGVIVVSRRGGFYFYKSAGKEDSVEKLPIEANNNFEEVLSYANGKHRISDYFNYIDVALRKTASNTELFASYLHWHTEESCLSLRVSKLTYAPGESMLQTPKADSDWVTVFDSIPCTPLEASPYLELTGGRMQFDPVGNLIVSVGSMDFFSDDPQFEPLVTNANHYGKVIKINLQDQLVSVVSSGHRNPQGVLLDRSGKRWLTEHVPKVGDELNLIVEGNDYGYPHVTYGTGYGRYTWRDTAEDGFHNDYQRPIHAWVPSIGTSNVIQIENFLHEWNGDLLLASMRANSLFRLRIREDRLIVSEQIEVGSRVRDLGQSEDGTIVLWTDNQRLILVRPIERARSPHEQFLQTVDEPLRKLVEIELEGCMRCHSLIADAPHGVGPNLWNLPNRKIARSSFDGYSPALRKFDTNWAQDNLNQYLLDPQAFAPGTTMPQGVTNPAVREAIVNLLLRLEEDRERESP